MLSATQASDQVLAWQYIDIWMINLGGFLSARILIKREVDCFPALCGAVLGGLFALFFMRERVNDWGLVGRFSIGDDNMNNTAYNIAGYMLLFCLTQTLILKKKYQKVIESTGWLIFGLCLWRLECTGALLSYFLMGCVRMNPFKVSKNTIKATVITFFWIGLLLPFGFFAESLVEVDLLRSRGTGDLSGRLEIWPFAVEKYLDNWFFGLGAGNFQLQTWNGSGTHHFPLTVALDAGLFGIVTMVIFASEFCKKTSGVEFGKSKINLFLFYSAYWLPLGFSGHWEVGSFPWVLIGIVLSVADCLTRKTQLKPAVEKLAITNQN